MAPPLDWPGPGWLRWWAAVMPALMALALGGLATFLPWPAPPALDGAALRPAAGLAALAAGVWLGLGYARAARRGRRPATFATFLWAAAFVWVGVAQAGPALPDPGPTLAVVWITAWVAAMAALALRF